MECIHITLSPSGLISWITDFDDFPSDLITSLTGSSRGVLPLFRFGWFGWDDCILLWSLICIKAFPC